MRALLATLLAPFAAAGDVLVVGPHAGADHAEIQAAVDAASDGDVVLVYSGAYQPFVITGKGVTVAERPGQDVKVVGGVHVTATDHHQGVTLIGLDIDADPYGPGAKQGLLAESVRGGLRVERCDLRGADGEGYSDFDDRGSAAVRLDTCLDVSLVHCTLEAGDGAGSFGGYEANRGGNGLTAQDANVAVHVCTVLGGKGGDHDIDGDGLEGYAGHGVVLFGASVLALHGSEVVGGDAGWGRFVCLDGGHGLWVTPLSHAQVLDSVLTAGQPDCSTGGGSPGEDLRVETGGSAQLLSGSARSHDAPTPTVGGVGSSFTFHGEPGDAMYLLLSWDTDFVLAPGLNGALLLATPLAMPRRFVGVVPASGSLSVTLTAPPPAPGEEAYVFETQAMAQDPSGQVWLATPSTWVVLK